MGIIDQIKQYYKLNRIFDDKTIDTMQIANNKICPLCKEICGSIAKLGCNCLNNMMCLTCVDNFYDSYHIEHSNDNNVLFPCITCGKEICDYIIT